MPRTLPYRPVLIDTLISNERLSSYARVFQPTNDVELMGVYLWNAHVCGAVYPLISAVEITLRNAIDQALTSDLGTFWWSDSKLKYRSFTVGMRPPYPVQAVRDNFIKATRKTIVEIRNRHRARGRIAPTHASVLAKSEFSTWEFLLDAEFMGRGLIWPKHLSMVFRGPWPVHQASGVLAHTRDLVATLREFRNRLFHYEPAWKRYGVQTEADALQHLRDKLDKLEKLLAFIHPENLRLLQVNGLLQAAHRACTAEEIRRAQHLAHVHHVGSLEELGELVATCATQNKRLTATLPPRPMQFSVQVP